jgi:uncharacterized protein (TIGR00299 family) protein
VTAPRRVLYVDGSSGAAGDMILGALVDVGVPLARMRRAVESLKIEGWRLSSRRVTRAGLTARKVSVRVRGDHHGRTWSEIRRIVQSGDLEPDVRARALAVFRRLIDAEAEVHGLAPDKVHLHEAGGIDAIVDVVGACVGFAHLALRRIVVSTLTTGFGTVRCSHGVYPVPAPATARLIIGVPVRGGELEVERLTPTGAAILTTVADHWGPLPAMRPTAVGYGAGDRDLGEDPNFLTMILGEETGASAVDDPGGGAETLVIEFNVDDAPPQVLAYASERLFAGGALEVYTTPIQMKKGRSGHQLTVLAPPDLLDRLASIVLEETTTLGLRYRRVGRIELDRELSAVTTPYGKVRIKVGSLDGRAVQAWPEYEDCAALARRRKIPLKEVQQAAVAEWRRRHRRRAPVRRRGRP